MEEKREKVFFTRNKEKFLSYIKNLEYKNIRELELEIGKRIRFDNAYLHKNFDIELLIDIYKALKKRWTWLYYNIEKDKIENWLKNTPLLDFTKLMNLLGYDIDTKNFNEKFIKGEV